MTAPLSGLTDGATKILAFALDGLDARQRAIASNTANVETPNYLAREVNFEDSLRSAIGNGDLSQATISVAQSQAATGLNGNNVQMDAEMLASSENVLRQRLMVQALNSKFSLLRVSITG